MRVFRPTKKHRTWHVEFTDHYRKRRRVSSYLRDRASAVNCGHNIEILVDAMLNGEDRPPVRLFRWIDSMHPDLRDALVRFGLLGDKWLAQRSTLQRPLKDLLPDWKASILAKSRTEKHAAASEQYALRLFEACDFERFRDIEPVAVAKKLKEWRDDEDMRLSNRASNAYLQAARQFCRWLCRQVRGVDNPLGDTEILRKLNEKTDRRRERRALSVDEAAVLLRETSKQPFRWNMTGEERSLVYHLAIGTGLRANEIRLLRRGDFILSAMPPRVIAPASITKNSEEASLDIASELSARLSQHFISACLMPAARAFKMPSDGNVSRMLKADLAAARKAWINEVKTPEEKKVRGKTDFLKYCDSMSRYADFHSLRHTHGVWLFEQYGLNPRQVQKRMRLSSLALVEQYTKSLRLDSEHWINRGPSLTTPDTASAKHA